MILKPEANQPSIRMQAKIIKKEINETLATRGIVNFSSEYVLVDACSLIGLS